MPKPYATRYFGFLVSHPEVMPYFTRAALRALDDKAEEHYETEDIELAKLDIGTFAQAIKTIPNEKRRADESAFYDEDLLERYEDVLSIDYELTGGFRTLVNLNRDDGEAPDDDFKFDYDTVHTIALSKQPNSLFMQCYMSYVEVEMEIRQILKDIGVEMPKDFPYQNYIGRVNGVIYLD